MDVGTGQHCIRIAESIGTDVISEQRPKLEKSLMMAALRCLPRLYKDESSDIPVFCMARIIPFYECSEPTSEHTCDTMNLFERRNPCKAFGKAILKKR
jgi:hypothetical protein